MGTNKKNNRCYGNIKMLKFLVKYTNYWELVDSTLPENRRLEKIIVIKKKLKLTTHNTT